MNTKSEICQQKIYDIAKSVRDELVHKYGDCLCGKCVEASEIIAEKLTQAGIECEIIEGWCVYDEFMGCSDRPYDEHTWVVATVCNKKLYIDVTADQFQPYIDEEIPPIIIGHQPTYMQIDEPDEEQLIEMGWF